MKFLIWFLCILANALITVFLKNTGVVLGAIPTVLLWLGTAWLARSLCKLYDEDQKEKGIVEKEKAEKVKEETGKNYLTECKNCGYRDETAFDFCPKCNSYKKRYIFPDEELSSINQIRFCRKCGEKLTDNSNVCQKCGTNVVEIENTVDIEQSLEENK